jgi:hypothetical protein
MEEWLQRREGGVGRFVKGFEKKKAQKKVTIILKPPKMKLMQVWFANTMWVDEALSIQNDIGVVMGVKSLKPLHHVIYICTKELI